MKNNQGASAEADQALAQEGQAPTGLDAPRFDPSRGTVAGIVVDGPSGPEFHVPRVAKPNLAALGLDDPESRN